MEKSKKAEKNLENQSREEINERYRPYLIHSSTYSILTDQILMLMPSQRNVLLSMNEYELHKINPAHPKNSDSPTHVILFCIRFIADDTFQPIGGLLTYKHIDQSAVLAECIKAYINDLWKLNLHVVATVSPPFKIFKDILGHLISNLEINKPLDVISYSVEPIKEIIHIYDVQFLIISLQNLLQEGDIMFKTPYQESKIFTASWKDISVIMNIAPEFKMLSDFLSSKENVQRRVHIFTEQIFIKYLEVKAKGLLSVHADGCIELLNAIRTFLKFFEYDFVYPPEYVTLNWSDLVYILTTMGFQNLKKGSVMENGCVPILRDKKGEVDNVKDKKNNSKSTSDKNISPTITNESLYKGFLAANAGLSPIQEFCDVLRKTKTFGVENGEISNTKNSKTDAFDLKAALREMNCDINLVNYGNEEVLIEENSNNQENKKGKSIDNKNKIVYIKCKDKNKLVTKQNSKKEESESDIKNCHCEKKYVGNKGEPPDYHVNFTENNITQELICTVKGIKQLMSLMARRRVRQIKPDALIVEHVDYLVTKIQSTINRVDSVHYYGHPYKFMDTDLAFSTLSNTKGLYLVSKD